jgi:hypothetical protein
MLEDISIFRKLRNKSMNTEPTTPTFNLLSIGQRGVGKTVFLAGSYIELHGDRRSDSEQQLWFDCQDDRVQDNVDNILSYISQAEKYPPPTMKITDFNFSLKRRQLWHTQTLSHFQWSDIPGEICTVHNRSFRSLVSNSHGCCVFIDAHALVHKQHYLPALEEIVKQVMAIASVAHLHDVHYPFAIILTKCDMLSSSHLQGLQSLLQPLTVRLDAVKAKYQTFCSCIPIDTSFAATLKPTGAAAPLLWLVWELSQSFHPSWQQNLHDLIIRLWSNNFQAWQNLGAPNLHSQAKGTNRADRAKQRLDLLPAIYKNYWMLIVTILALVGVIGLAYPQWHRIEPVKENQNISMPEN